MALRAARLLRGARVGSRLRLSTSVARPPVRLSSTSLSVHLFSPLCPRWARDRFPFVLFILSRMLPCPSFHSRPEHTCVAIAQEGNIVQQS